jgi:MFS family permease
VPTPISVLTRNRDFRRLFLAELVLFGGDWFVMVPLLGLLHRLTGHGLLGSLALAADTGMNALLLPYAGTVADRLDRRKIMVTASLSAIAAVTLLFFVHSGRSVWLGPVAVGGVAVAKAFYAPCVQAAMPNLVPREDLATANAVAGAAWGTMSVVGASLGGLVATLASPYTCFAVTAAGLSVAALLVLGVRGPMQSARERAADHPGPVAAIRESLRYLRRQPRVRALVTVKPAVGLGNGVLAAYPVLAVLLHVGDLGTGLFFAVRGAGALIGPLLLRGMLLGGPGRMLPRLALSMGTYGVAYVALAALHWFPAVLVLILVAHLGGGANWTMSNMALQAEVPDELRGRVFATDLMLATIAIAVSQLAVSAVIDRLDPWVLVAGCGMVTLVYAVGWRLLTARVPAPVPASGAQRAP